MSKHLTRMTIYDAEHYTDEERAAIIASYPAHERDARSKGIPILGSGRCFPIPEEDIACDIFDIPPHFARLGALDFGWDHPTAGIDLAHDTDKDIVYISRDYKKSEATPVEHSRVLKKWNLPVWCWPHDGEMRERGSGKQFSKLYAAEGLEMLPIHAQFIDGSISVAAGVAEMLTRMQTGRLKVFRHLEEWFSEFRVYHRKDGVIVAEIDDLMSCTRYAIVMLRFAEAMKPAFVNHKQKKRSMI